MPAANADSVLTDAMRRDLLDCVAVCERTRGTYDWPRGRAIRLRTGEALARRGLVSWANQYSANRCKSWLPTDAGIAAAKAITTTTTD